MSNNDSNQRGALTNFVPAVAVKRRGQVFFVMTGRKAHVEGQKSLNLNI